MHESAISELIDDGSEYQRPLSDLLTKLQKFQLYQQSFSLGVSHIWITSDVLKFRKIIEFQSP